MKIKRTFAITCFIVSAFTACKSDSCSAQTPDVKTTFSNPLLMTGPDPWVFQKDGMYYFCRTTGHDLEIIATRKMSALADAKPVTIWNPPVGEMYSKELWAPELHYLDGKWYMYFAADDGNNDHHRLYVIENADQNPLTHHWVFKGKVADPTNKWAIDGSVFMYKGISYMTWSGWEGDNNVSQNIYIAKLKNPWTIQGQRVMLSTPTYGWEKKGSGHGLPTVNEGPEALISPQGRLFIDYSASGCWTDDYALGLLSLKQNGDPMNAADWTKSDTSVFRKSIENSVYGTGHNGFFKSPDGKEDWIIYHANPKAAEGCSNYRSPRMQKFTWNKDGMPDFGIPVKTGVAMDVPSGE
ncbi:glycoside hydrolase family 43 protein [Arachidicoccus sp.]|uniref:glycoside hydrolase family 43 protein n=1 Tax=Arachidicoccus sp. TaxID=1872624 RepID=UPI003D204D1E